MKSELDELMKQYGVDWIFLTGPRYCNPDIIYYVGTAHVSNPVILKKRGEQPLLIHNSMESGEAAKCGLPCVDEKEILPREETKRLKSVNDRDLAFFRKLISHFRIKGKVCCYGINNYNKYSHLLHQSFGRSAFIKLVEGVGDLIEMVRATKDEDEINELSEVTDRNCRVFTGLFQYIKGLSAEGRHFIDGAGEKVTLGHLRKRVLLEMAANSLSPAETPIISMDGDAAVPHSTGDNHALVEAGHPIVLDIFPRSLDSGYVSDLTRTITVGEAPERVREIYALVDEALEIARRHISIDGELSLPDLKVSEFFEKKGFPTVKKSPGTTTGYVHSLGHGVGLELHEKPRISVFNSSGDERFKPGMVFTIEPGLYLPEEGLGVRLEEMVVLNNDNTLNVLSSLPRALEIHPCR